MPPSLPAKNVGVPLSVPMAAACWSECVVFEQVFFASLMFQQRK